MRAGLAVVLAGFAASRALAWTLGVRFDAAPLGYFWQYLDPTLLRTDLLGSLLHLHSQPPGFNALLGLVLKLGGDPAVWFASLYHGLGLAMALALFSLLARLGMKPVRAGIAVAIFTASPTAVLYESWLFYTHVVAVLLVFATWLVQSLARSGRMRDAILLSLVVAAIACTRSVFHLVWALAVLGGAVWLVAPRDGTQGRWRIALAMAPALLLVVGVYAKNAILFDSPSLSTWLGMSLSKLTTQRLDSELRADLIRAGELSAAAGVRPFSPLSKYPPDLVSLGPYGHPALDRQVKPGNYTNFNHGAYLRLNRIYLNDALHTMALYPSVYLESVGLAALRYAIPPSQYRFLSRNHAAYAPVDRIYEVLTGVPEAFGLERRKQALGPPGYLVRRIRWLYVGASLLAIGWALTRSRRLARQKDGHPERAVLLFCALAALWVALVGNVLELDENQRFHAMVEPLHVVLIAWMIERSVFGPKRRAKFGAVGVRS